MQHPPEWDIGCCDERRENEDGLQAHFFDGEVAQVGAAFLFEREVEHFGPAAVVPVHQLAVEEGGEDCGAADGSEKICQSKVQPGAYCGAYR